jgi:hypothetical protein
MTTEPFIFWIIFFWFPSLSIRFIGQLNLRWDLNEILGSYIVKDPIILVLVLVLVYKKEKHPLNTRVLSRFINC